jgi:hypothetical protein
MSRDYKNNVIVNDNYWRQYFIRQNFGIPTEGQIIDWGFWLNPHNFSKIALYGEDVKTHLNTNFLTPVDLITTSSGWYDAGDIGNPSKHLGVAAAAAHNNFGTAYYDRNLGFFDTLVPLLHQKNIVTVIVLPPTDVSYYPYINRTMMALTNQKLSEFANRHHIKFINYTADARFSSDDFTWEMPDHLNARGAMKFSKILDEEVIKALW